MNIIIPMAGMGKRMRPLTLTTPKPLIPVAGKPIVYRLVEDLAAMCDEKIDEIAFVISRAFGEEVENNLVGIAHHVEAQGKIYYQDEPLGTAHAILCAKEALNSHVIVAFADTLFYADFRIDTAQDGIIWTNRIEDPSAFGVVETDPEGFVKQLWEKPKEFVSDQAIIGIYYFRDGAKLRKEMQFLIDEDIKVKGEYQLTDALDNMRQNGARFRTASVTHWLDCGNKDATLDTNKIVLKLSAGEKLVSDDAKLENSVIVEPAFIGKGAVIRNSVIGPFASVGDNTTVENSIISDSIILNNAGITNANLERTIAGNFSVVSGCRESLNLGDYSESK